MDPKAYAARYEGDSPDALFFRRRLGIVLDLMNGLPEGRVLDAGCGPGVMARELIRRNWRVVGLDIDPAMIKECVESIGRSARSDFVSGPIERPPFPDESFDLVLAMGVLEYVKGKGGAGETLRELARVTKRGGTIITSMHNKLSPYRIWERAFYGRWLRARYPGRIQTVTTIYSKRSFLRFVAGSGLRLLDCVYYDFNVCPPPFDEQMPRRAAQVNQKLEPFLKKFLPWFGTGFVIKARKE